MLTSHKTSVTVRLLLVFASVVYNWLDPTRVHTVESCSQRVKLTPLDALCERFVGHDVDVALREMLRRAHIETLCLHEVYGSSIGAHRVARLLLGRVRAGTRRSGRRRALRLALREHDGLRHARRAHAVVRRVSLRFNRYRSLRNLALFRGGSHAR